MLDESLIEKSTGRGCSDGVGRFTNAIGYSHWADTYRCEKVLEPCVAHTRQSGLKLPHGVLIQNGNGLVQRHISESTPVTTK